LRCVCGVFVGDGVVLVLFLVWFCVFVLGFCVFWCATSFFAGFLVGFYEKCWFLTVNIGQDKKTFSIGKTT
jgi:hypothetical protein